MEKRLLQEGSSVDHTKSNARTFQIWGDGLVSTEELVLFYVEEDSAASRKQRLQKLTDQIDLLLHS
jgi:hypothetical protein